MKNITNCFSQVSFGLLTAIVLTGMIPAAAWADHRHLGQCTKAEVKAPNYCVTVHEPNAAGAPYYGWACDCPPLPTLPPVDPYPQLPDPPEPLPEPEPLPPNTDPLAGPGYCTPIGCFWPRDQNACDQLAWETENHGNNRSYRHVIDTLIKRCNGFFPSSQ